MAIEPSRAVGVLPRTSITAETDMNKRLIVPVALLLATTSCNGCADEIVKDVITLGSVKFTVKRIAGAHYFTLDKGDSKDGYTPQNGFLCVTHNPGCGW